MERVREGFPIKDVYALVRRGGKMDAHTWSWRVSVNVGYVDEWRERTCIHMGHVTTEILPDAVKLAAVMLSEQLLRYPDLAGYECPDASVWYLSKSSQSGGVTLNPPPVSSGDAPEMGGSMVSRVAAFVRKHFP